MSKPTYPTLLGEEDLRRSASGEYFYTFDKSVAEKELRLVGRVRRDGSRFFLQDEATGKEEEIPADKASVIFTASTSDKSFKEGDPIILLPAGQQTGAAAYAKMVGIVLNVQPDVAGTTFLSVTNNEVWWRGEEGIKLIPASWPQTESKEDPARKSAEEAKKKAAVEEAKRKAEEEERKKFEEARRLEHEARMTRAEYAEVAVEENPPMTTKKDNKEAATAAMTKTVTKVMSTIVLRALVKRAIKLMVRMGVPRELATHKMVRAALMIAIPKVLSLGAHYIPEGLPMLQDPNGLDRRQIFIDSMSTVAEQQYERQIEILTEQFTGDFLDRLMERLTDDDDLEEELDEEEEERARRRKKAKARRRDDDDDDDDKEAEINKLKKQLAKAQAALPPPKKKVEEDSDDEDDEDEEVAAKPRKKKTSSIQLQDSADD